MQIRSVRTLPDGRTMNRITEVVLRTLRVVPNPVHGQLDVPVESLGWTLPIDDTHYRIFTAGRVREQGVFLPDATGKGRNRRRWFERSEAERRAKPGDWEAQVGQGPITFHSEEHLASSDRGVLMVRRALLREVEAVARGEDPVGVSFDPAAPPVRLAAGNWLAGNWLA